MTIVNIGYKRQQSNLSFLSLFGWCPKDLSVCTIFSTYIITYRYFCLGSCISIPFSRFLKWSSYTDLVSFFCLIWDYKNLHTLEKCWLFKKKNNFTLCPCGIKCVAQQAHSGVTNKVQLLCRHETKFNRIFNLAFPRHLCHGLELDI